MKYIKLNGNRGEGKYAIVDDDDYEWVSKYNWHIETMGYARRAESRLVAKAEGRSRRGILMHREINQTPDGLFTDHINGNKLDNRKCNLRNCTTQENGRNRKQQKRHSSKYKGVFKNNKEGQWQTSLKNGKKTIVIGTFSNEEACANAYNYYAKQYFGEFARLADVDYMDREEWEKYRITHGNTYTGVRFHKTSWNVKIYYNKKEIHLGCFTDEVAGANCYNYWAKQYGLPLNDCPQMENWEEYRSSRSKKIAHL